MSTKDDKNIQFSEYAGKFTDQVNNADKLRTDAMLRLQNIRGARQKIQQRQLKRISEKFGKEHPRVLRQADRIANEKQVGNFLTVTVIKAKVETAAPKDSFVFQGRILTDDIRGVSGVVVQLQDSRNNIIGKPVKTDKDGAYSLILDIDKSFKFKQLSAVVLDTKGTQIHKETLPVLIKPNAVELRDIVIVSTDKPNKGGFSTPEGGLKIKKELAPKETVAAKKTVKTKDVLRTKEAVAPKAKVTTKKAVKRRVVRKTSSKLTK